MDKGSHGRMNAPPCKKDTQLHCTRCCFSHPKHTRLLSICWVVDITQVFIAGTVANTLVELFDEDHHEFCKICKS